METYPSLWSPRTNDELAGAGLVPVLQSVAIVTAAVLAAVVYGCLAMYVLVSPTFAMGHVVQDGVDTGDLLALPPAIVAVACVVFAVYAASSRPRYRPARRLPAFASASAPVHRVPPSAILRAAPDRATSSTRVLSA